MEPPLPPLHAVSAEAVGSLAGRRLLVLLHGRGADERDLLPLAPMLAGGDAVIAVRAPIELHPGASWAEGSWEDVLRGTGVDASADRVLALLDDLAARLGAPEDVRLLGFSQGGAVALSMLRRAPGRFRRVVLLSGFVPDGVEAGDAELAGDPPAVFWGRGEADEVIPADAIRRTGAWLAQHARTTVRVYPGLSHTVSEEEVADVRGFLIQEQQP